MINSEQIRITFDLSSIGAVNATPFKVIDSTWLVAKLIRTSDDAVVNLTESTDYTITGVGDDSGADISLVPYETANNVTDWNTFDTGPWQLLLTLDIPITQLSDYITDGRLSSQLIEDDFDKIIQILQLNKEGVNSDASSLNIQFPDNEPTATSNKLPSNASRLGKIAAWNATTGEFEAISLNTTGSGMQGPATQVDGRLAIFSATTDLLKDNADIAESLFIPQTLVYGATVNWDSDLGHDATLNLSGDPTLNVINIKPGRYSLIVRQDATGGRTINFNTGFSNASNVQLDTDSNAISVVQFVSDGTSLYPVGGSAAAKAVAGMVGTYQDFAYDISAVEDDIGYLVCNGQVVSRSKYADLFDVISTDYNTGGEAGSDFRLPDLQTAGRFRRASATVGTLQDDATAVNGLDNVNGSTSTFVPSNTNLVEGATVFATTLTVGGPNNVYQLGGVDVTHNHTVDIAITSSDSETRPTNISCMVGIKF